MADETEGSPKPRYTWPWFLLGALLLGLALAIFWMSILVRRTREQRDFTTWPSAGQTSSQTNSPPPKTNAP
jgi:F0F1-type ATP synthase assembly protein I